MREKSAVNRALHHTSTFSITRTTKDGDTDQIELTAIESFYVLEAMHRYVKYLENIGASEETREFFIQTLCKLDV